MPRQRGAGHIQGYNDSVTLRQHAANAHRTSWAQRRAGRTREAALLPINHQQAQGGVEGWFLVGYPHFTAATPWLPGGGKRLDVATASFMD